MPIASARISDELHEKIQIESALAGISVSDFIRSAIDNEVNGRIQENGHPPSTENSPAFALLSEQLKEKDQQISQLHQLVAMSQKHSDDLLEDLRKPRSWWHFWQKNGK